MEDARIGVWLIGTKGGVASTAILGLLALKKGLAARVGLVSELPQFQQLGLADWSRLVVGGHEIRRTGLFDEALRMARESREAGLRDVVEGCRAELDEIDGRIRPGTILGVGPTIAGLADEDVPRNETPHAAIARLRGDLTAFVAAEGLAHLVVVNVASTEPAADVSSLPPNWAELERLIGAPHCTPHCTPYCTPYCTPHAPREGGAVTRSVTSTMGDGTRRVSDTMPDTILPASSLYPIAALQEGYSYINFTPSLGSTPAAIDDLARLRGARHYGCDGKTGETLMKSVLAPMFARRNLQVLSWVGHNIFGNMDGQVLSDPANKETKVASKDRLVREILGYQPKTLVSIEYVPDLGDWKTAWDHIHFAGFLGVPMTLQFIWQGCDSLLAAPLVLDLVRFTELAWRRNHVGAMPFLASFFKSPYGVSEHGFDRQFEMLEQWARNSETASGRPVANH
jgi:myo-inositol-1-phosphate synthase